MEEEQGGNYRRTLKITKQDLQNFNSSPRKYYYGYIRH
jgi:hypothetical protein